MADNVEIVFGAKIDGLVAGVGEVKHQLEGIRESTNKVTEGAKSMLEVFGIGLSLAGIVEFVNSMSELGEKLEQTADRLGLTNQKIVEMSGMAKLTGTSLEALSMSVERMSLNVQRAASSAIDPTAQALRVLGLNAKELVGLSTDQYFLKLAGAVEKFNPSLNLTNALMQIGGRSFANMMPILREGAEGWAKYQKMVREASEGLAAAVPGMADTNTKIGVLSLSLQSFGARVFSVLKPAIDTIVTSMAKWLQSLDTPTIIAGIQKVADAVMTIMGVVGTFSITIMGMIDQFTAKIDTFGNKAAAAAGGAAGGAVGGAIVGGPLGAAGGAIGGGLAGWFGAEYAAGDKAAAEGNEKVAERTRQLGLLLLKFKTMMQGITSNLNPEPAHEKPDGANAGAINFNIANQLAAQASNIDRQVSMLQAQAERNKLIYQFDVDTFQITQSRKTELLQASLSDEYGKEKALIEQKAALYRGQPEKYAEVQKQLTALEETYTTNRLRVAQDGIRQQVASWKEMTDALQSSFNSQLRGLLAGTTSWSQAFKSVLGDMIIFFIQAIEKMVVNWLLGKAVMAAADKTGLAEQAATAAAAQVASGVATVAAIQQKVALVYAGAAAFFAPLLGPGAPAAAAGVAATVDTAATALALAGSAEQGAYEVTGGLWQLHDKETVLPAPAAQAFRDFAEGGGNFGGGSGPHFHGMLLDGQSIARFFRQYGHLIPGRS